MQETLFLRLNPWQTDQAQWLIKNKSAKLQFYQGTLKQAANDCKNRHVILIVPSSQVLLTEINLPSTSRRQLFKALPYALEEFLIQDIESQHFAIRLNKTSNQHAVAVINKQILSTWLTSLANTYAIKPHSAVPDLLLMPQQTDWNMLINDGLCYVRTGKYQGFVCTSEQLLNYLQTNISFCQDNKPKHIAYWGKPELIPNTVIEQLDKHKIQLNQQGEVDNIIYFFASNYQENDIINLLQNSFARHSQAEQIWHKWLPATSLMLIWLIIQATIAVINYHQVKKQIDTLSKEAITLYQSVEPNSTKTSRLRQRMAKKLTQLQKQQLAANFDFIDLLAITGRIIKNVDDFKLSNMKFENNKLVIYFSIIDASKIDSIEQSLRKSGLYVLRGSAKQSKQGYTSHLIISGGRS